MSDKNAKDIRKQLRNVVQEKLEEILASELYAKLAKDLKSHTDKRLDDIEKHLKSVLNSIDTRHKDVMDHLLRSTTSSVPSSDKK